MFQLKNKVAIVTGGSSGIGFETVRLLLECGAKVAFCGRNQERLQLAQKSLVEEYPQSFLLAYSCDVLQPSQVENFVEQVAANFGGLDLLICNAGQAHVGGLDEIETDVWLSEVQLKLFSVLNMVKASRELLRKSSIASITCVNSLLSLQPEPHLIATAAARAHLLNVTHNLAHHLIDEGIRVNSILVGMIESGQWQRRFEQRTDLSLDFNQWLQSMAQKRGIPMKRLGKPIEAARALLFLASPLASYSTGTTIDVSGGFSKQL